VSFRSLISSIMLLPRSVMNALSNPRLLTLVVILTILSRPVHSFNLKNVPKYSDNEKHRQSLGVNVRSRKNILAGQSSNSIHRKEHKKTQYSFAIQASTAELTEKEHLTSDALQEKRRRFLKLVAAPIIMCGFFYFYIIPSASAATAAAASASSSAAIKATARNVLSERQSILIKGFISGACINFAKNILLHPIETG
jgi:zona occludens toxin (predicted ATPase)